MQWLLSFIYLYMYAYNIIQINYISWENYLQHSEKCVTSIGKSGPNQNQNIHVDWRPLMI